MSSTKAPGDAIHLVITGDSGLIYKPILTINLVHYGTVPSKVFVLKQQHTMTPSYTLSLLPIRRLVWFSLPLILLKDSFLPLLLPRLVKPVPFHILSHHHLCFTSCNGRRSSAFLRWLLKNRKRFCKLCINDLSLHCWVWGRLYCRSIKNCTSMTLH